MQRTSSNTKIVIPASTAPAQDKAVETSPGKKGPATDVKKLKSYDDFDYSFETGIDGEPRTLHSDSNLSVHSTTLGATDSTVDTSKLVIPGYDQDNVENSHLDAMEGDSSREEDEPVPPPKLLQTTRETAPPAPQFSDDPAIAALQKSQLENTKSVVSYTESLDILNQALADNPTLPRNSFDFVRKILSDGLKRCTDRAQELSDGAQQALDAHAEQARRLAAGAQGDCVAVGEGDETFSMDSIGTVTDADLDHELNVLKGLVSPSAHQRVETAVKTALNGGLESVDQDLATLYQQVNEEAEKAQQQQENDEQLAQLAAWHGNNAAQLDDLFSQLEANIQEEADRDFDEELDDALAFVEGMNAEADQLDQLDQLLNDLDSGPATPAQVTSPSTQQGDSTQAAQAVPTHTGPVDLDSIQDELLAEAELILEQEHKEKAALKPLELSDDIRREIEREVYRYKAFKLEAFYKDVELVKNRQLTKKEQKSPQFAAQETKRKTHEVIANYHLEQRLNIEMANRKLNAIDADELLADAEAPERLKEVTASKEKRKAAMDLMSEMESMLLKLWA